MSTYNFPAIVRGDTFPSKDFTFVKRIDESTAEDIDVVSATMVMRTTTGTLIHTFTLSVTDNVVTVNAVPSSVTDDWVVGAHKYALQIVRDDTAQSRTWITGEIEVKENPIFQ
jgi:hypothetical protein